MILDSLTLMAVGSFATAVSGFLLLGSWQQIRGPALLWWAAANFINAPAIGLLAFGITTGNVAVIAIASGLSGLSPAFNWAGARAFGQRKQLWPLLFAGAATWMVAGVVPATGGTQAVPMLASFGAWVVYLGATIFELWRSREERLAARWPLVGFLALHALVFLGGVYDTITSGPPSDLVPLFTNWFSFVHLETVIYAIATPIFMVLLCKERNEQRHINAARKDSLTGIANRGSFLENAERALRRCQADGRSFSLILFDLDRFKHVNDTYGHDVGDEVLRVFTETTRAVLRPSDLFGRYGGEEFTVVLPGATIEAAYVIAERIRHKFAEAGAIVAGRQLNATVSGGVASATVETTIEALVRTADQNMYRAKSLGRNRVERPGRDHPAGEERTGGNRAGDNVIRVA